MDPKSNSYPGGQGFPMIFMAEDTYTFSGIPSPVSPVSSVNPVNPVNPGTHHPRRGSDLMWADDGLARHDMSGELVDGCPFEVPAARILARSAFSS